MPGLAVRLAARRARGVFLGLPGPAERLPARRAHRQPAAPGTGALRSGRPGGRGPAPLRAARGSHRCSGCWAAAWGRGCSTRRCPGSWPPGEAAPLAVVHLAGGEAADGGPAGRGGPATVALPALRGADGVLLRRRRPGPVPRRGDDHLRAGRHRHAGGAGAPGSGRPAAQRRLRWSRRAGRAWCPRPTRRGCPRWWAACWPTRQPAPGWPRGPGPWPGPGAADEIAAAAAGGGGWLTWRPSAASTWWGWAGSA